MESSPMFMGGEPWLLDDNQVSWSAQIDDQEQFQPSWNAAGTFFFVDEPFPSETTFSYFDEDNPYRRGEIQYSGDDILQQCVMDQTIFECLNDPALSDVGQSVTVQYSDSVEGDSLKGACMTTCISEILAHSAVRSAHIAPEHVEVKDPLLHKDILKWPWTSDSKYCFEDVMVQVDTQNGCNDHSVFNSTPPLENCNHIIQETPSENSWTIHTFQGSARPQHSGITSVRFDALQGLIWCADSDGYVRSHVLKSKMTKNNAGQHENVVNTYERYRSWRAFQQQAVTDMHVTGSTAHDMRVLVSSRYELRVHRTGGHLEHTYTCDYYDNVTSVACDHIQAPSRLYCGGEFRGLFSIDCHNWTVLRESPTTDITTAIRMWRCQLAIGTGSGVVCIREKSTLNDILRIGAFRGSILDVACSGYYLAVTGRKAFEFSPYLKIFDLRHPSLPAIKVKLPDESHRPQFVARHPSQKNLVICNAGVQSSLNGGHLYSIELSTGNVYTVPTGRNASTMTTSPPNDSNHLASSYQDGASWKQNAAFSSFCASSTKLEFALGGISGSVTVFSGEQVPSHADDCLGSAVGKPDTTSMPEQLLLDNVANPYHLPGRQYTLCEEVVHALDSCLIQENSWNLGSLLGENDSELVPHTFLGEVSSKSSVESYSVESNTRGGTTSINPVVGITSNSVSEREPAQQAPAVNSSIHSVGQKIGRRSTDSLDTFYQATQPRTDPMNSLESASALQEKERNQGGSLNITGRETYQRLLSEWPPPQALTLCDMNPNEIDWFILAKPNGRNDPHAVIQLKNPGIFRPEEAYVSTEFESYALPNPYPLNLTLQDIEPCPHVMNYPWFMRPMKQQNMSAPFARLVAARIRDAAHPWEEMVKHCQGLSEPDQANRDSTGNSGNSAVGILNDTVLGLFAQQQVDYDRLYQTDNIENFSLLNACPNVVGLENTLSDCLWLNVLVQAFYHFKAPDYPLRHILLNHWCRRRNCIACEIGMIYHNMVTVTQHTVDTERESSEKVRVGSDGNQFDLRCQYFNGHNDDHYTADFIYSSGSAGGDTVMEDTVGSRSTRQIASFVHGFMSSPPLLRLLSVGNLIRTLRSVDDVVVSCIFEAPKLNCGYHTCVFLLHTGLKTLLQCIHNELQVHDTVRYSGCPNQRHSLSSLFGSAADSHLFVNESSGGVGNPTSHHHNTYREQRNLNGSSQSKAYHISHQPVKPHLMWDIPCGCSSVEEGLHRLIHESGLAEGNGFKLPSALIITMNHLYLNKEEGVMLEAPEHITLTTAYPSPPCQSSAFQTNWHGVSCGAGHSGANYINGKARSSATAYPNGTAAAAAAAATAASETYHLVGKIVLALDGHFLFFFTHHDAEVYDRTPWAMINDHVATYMSRDQAIYTSEVGITVVAFYATQYLPFSEANISSLVPDIANNSGVNVPPWTTLPSNIVGERITHTADTTMYSHSSSLTQTPLHGSNTALYSAALRSQSVRHQLVLASTRLFQMPSVVRLLEVDDTPKREKWPALNPYFLRAPTSVPRRVFNHLGPGTLVGIDAEYVVLDWNQSFGGRKPPMSLARVSCVLQNGYVLVDDYIAVSESVLDYVTRYSGIHPGDLTVATSRRNLTTFKSCWTKLKVLQNMGVRFVGHGLAQDFRVLHLAVPRHQVLDTVELYRLPSQRKISLKYLMNYVFAEDIQSAEHDSVEDASAALRLYLLYEDLYSQGKHTDFILELYQRGSESNWSI